MQGRQNIILLIVNSIKYKGFKMERTTHKVNKIIRRIIKLLHGGFSMKMMFTIIVASMLAICEGI